MPARAASDDPLALVMAPPADETPEQQATRLMREDEDRRISDAIDESLKLERQQQRKKKVVKLLLLGQSESGKSTTLRQFQRLYTPSAFREERVLWRSVIQLNLVRSVRKILDAIAEHADAVSALESMSGGEGDPDPDADADADAYGDAEGDSDYADEQSQYHTPNRNQNRNRRRNRSQTRTHGERQQRRRGREASAELHELALRLLPLRHIEKLLIAKLVPPGEDEATHFGAQGYGEGGLGAGPSSSVNGNGNAYGSGYGNGNANGYANAYTNGNGNAYTNGNGDAYTRGNGNGNGYASGAGSSRSARNQEIFVRPGAAWKGFVARGKGGSGSSNSTSNNSGSVGVSGGGGHARPSSAGPSSLDLQDEPTAVLYEFRQDLMDLWRDPAVRSILKARKIRLEEQPGFFLNDLERITSLKYMPSDNDVLKARLKTVGVSEYKFEMETAAGRESGTEWRIVDVGGSRSQRPTWVPFFDDVDAIIFLAPISSFDQVLAEDRSVNRLEDSVLLWKMICSNKLLANVELVLFLNKCDILDKKLKTGVQLAKYVRSFQDRPNDSETVQKYFRAKFAAIQREYSPNPRKFYGFCTSVTDITTTSGILASVRDMVVREHLKRSKLL